MNNVSLNSALSHKKQSNHPVIHKRQSSIQSTHKKQFNHSVIHKKQSSIQSTHKKQSSHPVIHKEQSSTQSVCKKQPSHLIIHKKQPNNPVILKEPSNIPAAPKEPLSPVSPIMKLDTSNYIVQTIQRKYQLKIEYQSPLSLQINHRFFMQFNVAELRI